MATTQNSTFGEFFVVTAVTAVIVVVIDMAETLTSLLWYHADNLQAQLSVTSSRVQANGARLQQLQSMLGPADTSRVKFQVAAVTMTGPTDVSRAKVHFQLGTQLQQQGHKLVTTGEALVQLGESLALFGSSTALLSSDMAAQASVEADAGQRMALDDEMHALQGAKIAACGERDSEMAYHQVLCGKRLGTEGHNAVLRGHECIHQGSKLIQRCETLIASAKSVFRQAQVVVRQGRLLLDMVDAQEREEGDGKGTLGRGKMYDCQTQQQ